MVRQRIDSNKSKRSDASSGSDESGEEVEFLDPSDLDHHLRKHERFVLEAMILRLSLD